MSTQSNTADKINAAWRYQREGRTDAAIKEFQAVLAQNPDDIDANYGLGLSQRVAGNTADAVKLFEKTLEIVNRAKADYDATRTTEQLESHIKTPDDDRLMMLTRMIKQRLEETRVATS